MLNLNIDLNISFLKLCTLSPKKCRNYVVLGLNLQLNLFLARLSGNPIGLTAMNLFVIDKPAILTVSITEQQVNSFVKKVPSHPGYWGMIQKHALL